MLYYLKAWIVYKRKHFHRSWGYWWCFIFHSYCWKYEADKPGYRWSKHIVCQECQRRWNEARTYIHYD